MQRCDNCSRIWRDAAGRWICNKSLVSLLRQNERLDFALLERVFLYKGERKFSPAYFERLPISSAILRSWLYFASLSDRHGAPVLICPVCNPTTRSAHEKIKKKIRSHGMRSSSSAHSGHRSLHPEIKMLRSEPTSNKGILCLSGSMRDHDSPSRILSHVTSVDSL